MQLGRMVECILISGSLGTKQVFGSRAISANIRHLPISVCERLLDCAKHKRDSVS